jgi:hypothetical protein
MTCLLWLAVAQVFPLERVCARIVSFGDVGDECHLVFVGPTVQHVTDKHSHLFNLRHPTMRQSQGKRTLHRLCALL